MEPRRPTKHKLPVKVRADHMPDGRIVPLLLRPEDGEVARIDAILDVREAPALKAGGHGTRYLVRVGDQRLALFDESGKWFLQLD